MSVMGVDLGGRKVACAVLDGTHLVMVGAWSASSAAPRQAQLYEVAQYVTRLVIESGVSYVFIEAPLIGRGVKASMMLAEMKGAVLTQLAPLPVQIEMVDQARWKLSVVGAGNAKKDAVKLHISGANGAYPAMCGSDQDKYDAVAIGLYGDSVVRAAANPSLADS